jgi:sugar lactone lactonase YvrE
VAVPAPRRLRAELALALELQLGEGPVWDAATGELLFVDILAPAVHRWRPSESRSRSEAMPRHVGAVAPTADGALLVALADGCYRLAGDDLALVAPFTPDSSLRANDGKVDPGGRFLIGTMAYDGVTPGGALYRLDPGARELRLLRDGVAISNGIGWTASGTTMYYVDTPTRRIDRHAYDPRTGALGSPEPFVDIPPDAGSPDGLAVDEDGFVWVALWGGWAVHRYAPDGRLDAVVDVPVAQPSSCAFGGPLLDALYITSARDGLDAAALAAQPLAGSIFQAVPGVRGVPIGAFGQGSAR